MRITPYIIFLLSFIWSACNTETTSNEVAEIDDKKSSIIKEEMTSGKGYLLRNIKYTKPIGKLNFSVEAGLRKDSSVALKFNYYTTLNFQENLQYQKELMSAVMEDFKGYPIISVFLGRLIYTGDLAIAVSKNVITSDWDGKDYIQLKSILDSSALVNNYEELFNNHNIQIEGTTFEKAFFVDSSQARNYSIFTTPPDQRTEKILDASVWLRLKSI